MSKTNQRIVRRNGRAGAREGFDQDGDFDAEQPAQGVRLVKAFLRITDPRQRAWLIEQAEAMAAR